MTAQDKNSSSASQNDTAKPYSVSPSPSGKEKEVVNVKAKEGLTESLPEVELPKQVEKAGVEKISATIKLPPDVQKLKVTPSGSQVPVSAVVPSLKLPLTDDNIIKSLHAPLTSAIKWLAVWCVRKLQKAHLVLKSIHGKIVRVKVQ